MVCVGLINVQLFDHDRDVLRVNNPPVSPAIECLLPTAELRQQRVSEASELAALLEATAVGDQSAFALLYDRTSSRVYGMALRVLRDVNLAEDTTQEVFLQVWRSASNYNALQGAPLAWLMTIAHRRAVDRVRSEQSGSDRESVYGAVMQDSVHDIVLESVTQRLESEAVTTCLKTLTEAQWESVQLAYYRGLTYREVAENLDVALPTIKSRIRDGLTKLKTCLGVSL
ncbi:MAG: ECF RNA polymerase sigma factor SigK [Mycobacteriaceae bacterium]